MNASIEINEKPSPKKISSSISIDFSEAQSQIDDLFSLFELKFGTLHALPKRINNELSAVANDIIFTDSSAAGCAGLDVVCSVRFGAKYEFLASAIRAGELDSECL